jgi:hypothetical protein
MTEAQFNQGVQADINAKLARAASELMASNLNAAEVYLDRAAAAQKAYWDALAALERALGFEINTDELGEISSYSVRDLYNKFA